MALVECLDCGQNISSEALACPHCGRPPNPVKAEVRGEITPTRGQAAETQDPATPEERAAVAADRAAQEAVVAIARAALTVGGCAFLGYMLGLYEPVFSDQIWQRLCQVGAPCRAESARQYAIVAALVGFGIAIVEHWRRPRSIRDP